MLKIPLLVLMLALNAQAYEKPNHSQVSNGIRNDKVLNCVLTNGYHVYEEERICPLNGKKFPALTLGMHSTFGRSLDWEPTSYMRFPIPLPICPTNGFVVAKEEYSKDDLKRLKVVVKSDSYKKLYKQQHATYYLYAKMLELAGEKAENQWFLYLNATWEADNCGNQQRYKEYSRLVIKEAKVRLSNLNPDNQEYWMLQIIIPNMYRRVGDFSKAKKYLTGFREPTLEDEKTNKFFSLAKELLETAISLKNSSRVAIEEAKTHTK